MLMLLFYVEEECWAIAANDIKNLASLVTLQPFSKDAQSAIGLLNYHGEPLLTFDVSAILGNCAAPNALSTRIAVVETAAETTAGLILDRAYTSAKLSSSVTSLPSELPDCRNSYIQAVWKEPDGGIIRQLAVAPFLTTQLSSAAAGQTSSITDRTTHQAASHSVREAGSRAVSPLENIGPQLTQTRGR